MLDDLHRSYAYQRLHRNSSYCQRESIPRRRGPAWIHRGLRLLNLYRWRGELCQYRSGAGVGSYGIDDKYLFRRCARSHVNDLCAQSDIESSRPDDDTHRSLDNIDGNIRGVLDDHGRPGPVG